MVQLTSCRGGFRSCSSNLISALLLHCSLHPSLIHDYKQGDFFKISALAVTKERLLSKACPSSHFPSIDSLCLNISSSFFLGSTCVLPEGEHRCYWSQFPRQLWARGLGRETETSGRKSSVGCLQKTGKKTTCKEKLHSVTYCLCQHHAQEMRHEEKCEMIPAPFSWGKEN